MLFSFTDRHINIVGERIIETDRKYKSFSGFVKGLLSARTFLVVFYSTYMNSSAEHDIP